MVSWDQLFHKLLERKVNMFIVRLLLFIYTNQKCHVKWLDARSTNFEVSNGVRQGMPTSAILYIVYTNDLIKLLQDTEIGCYLNGVFVGAWLFFDDIFLLSATGGGLQAMMNVFE